MYSLILCLVHSTLYIFYLFPFLYTFWENSREASRREAAISETSKNMYNNKLSHSLNLCHMSRGNVSQAIGS